MNHAEAAIAYGSPIARLVAAMYDLLPVFALLMAAGGMEESWEVSAMARRLSWKEGSRS